jgi:hypothetical protein
LISAINPTPQEAFSSAGSNRPKPDALIVVLALPAETPHALQRRRRNPPCAGSHFPARTGGQLILEATFVPLKGLWLLFRRRPTRPCLTGG